MPGMTDAVFEDQNGTVIAIEVTASSKTNQFPAGYNEWRKTIGCRVTPPATEGKANRAVIAAIAKSLGVPLSTVSILSGMTSSQKKVRVSGLGKAQVIEILVTHKINQD